MLLITKRLSFSAAHRLYDPKLSDEENIEIFGKCSYMGGHGHNYILEVTVSGEIDKNTGMVLNIKRLKNIIKKEIIEKLDHKNLNTNVDFLKNHIPTIENMAICIWDILDTKIKVAKLYEIKLFETENNFITYRKND